MSMKDIKNFPAFESLVNEIAERKKLYMNIAASEEAMTKIYRAQGAVEALDGLLNFIEIESSDKDFKIDEPDQLPR